MPAKNRRIRNFRTGLLYLNGKDRRRDRWVYRIADDEATSPLRPSVHRYVSPPRMPKAAVRGGEFGNVYLAGTISSGEVYGA